MHLPRELPRSPTLTFLNEICLVQSVQQNYDQRIALLHISVQCLIMLLPKYQFITNAAVHAD